MPNNTYPSTIQKPLQMLSFIFDNGAQANTLFKPRSDASGTFISHVDMEYTSPAYSTPQILDAKGQTWTIIEAGNLAYVLAQRDATHIGAVIAEALLGGQEFLYKTDVIEITNGAIPVTVV